jgi:hypothetical protein
MSSLSLEDEIFMFFQKSKISGTLHKGTFAPVVGSQVTDAGCLLSDRFLLDPSKVDAV